MTNARYKALIFYAKHDKIMNNLQVRYSILSIKYINTIQPNNKMLSYRSEALFVSNKFGTYPINL